MAVTLTSLLSLVDSADTVTGWSGNSGGQDLEVYVQGGGTPASYTWQSGKNAIKIADFTHASGVDGSSYTYPHLYYWMRDDVFPFSEDKTTGAVNNSGLMVEVTLSNAATKKWHIAGADTWRGEWKNLILDLNNTSDLFSSSGTWDLSLYTVDKVEWQVDLSNSGTIRIIDNTWQDVLRIGEGLKATGTAFDFLDIANTDSALANMYGVLQATNGVNFAQGKVQIGDGATTTTFNSSGEQLIFIDPTTAGLGGGAIGSVNPNLYELKATGSACDFVLSGGVIAAAGNTTFKFDIADATLNALQVSGNTISKASATLLPTHVSGYYVSGNTFDTCGYIDVNGTVFENNTINNTTETTYGAIRVQANADLTYANGININSYGSNYAIYVDASVTEITLDNFQFDNPDGSGGNYALYWHGTSGTLTVNCSNGTNLAQSGTEANTGGTISVENAVTFRLTNVVSGTNVYAYNTTDSAVLISAQTISTDPWSVSVPANKAYWIKLAKGSSEPFYESILESGDTGSGVDRRIEQNLD